MRLVLHSVATASIRNLRTWSPEDPEVFCETLYLYIGPGPRSHGTNIFTITAATPKGLMARGAVNNIICEGPMLIIQVYDWTTLWSWLDRTVRACLAPTWDESVQRLRRWFRWEYD